MIRTAFLVISIALLFGCASSRTTEKPVETIEPAEKLDPGFYKSTQDQDMYSRPDAGSRSEGRLEAGAIVKVVDCAGAFAQVKYSENAGWIPTSFAAEAGPEDVIRTIGKVRAKESPNGDSPTMEVLDSGRLLSVISRRGEWLLVKISENRAWVMSDGLEPMGTTTPSSKLSEAEYWKVRKKSNLRASPALASEILRLMPAGATVQYLGEEDDWVHVSYDGTIGYVYRELVEPF